MSVGAPVAPLDPLKSSALGSAVRTDTFDSLNSGVDRTSKVDSNTTLSVGVIDFVGRLAAYSAATHPKSSEMNFSSNSQRAGYANSQNPPQWSFSDSLVFPAAPTRPGAPTPTTASSNPSNNLSNMPDSSFASWQQPSMQPQAGPSKYADAWCPTNSYPNINLSTGNRYTQLLEEKLGMEKQRNPRYQDNFVSSAAVDFSSYNDFLQTQWQSQAPAVALPAQGQLASPSSYGPTQYTNHLLAVETALHDLSQVMIPPDLVAPLPPQEFFDTTRFNPNLAPGDANFARISPTLSSRNSPVSNQSAPPSRIPSGPFTWTMSEKAYQDSLPPLLKVRVHPSDTQASNSGKVPPPPAGTAAPGTWAVNLLSDPSGAWPTSSPSASSADFLTPRFAPAKVPTPPPSDANPRKRQRTTSAPQSSPEGSHARMSAPASASGHSSSPHDESSRAATDAASGAEADADGDEKKVVIACYNCRAKKLRCDGNKPKCHHCKRRGEDKCEYDTKLRRRGPGKKNKLKARESVDMHRRMPHSGDGLTHPAGAMVDPQHQMMAMHGALDMGGMPMHPEPMNSLPGAAMGMLSYTNWLPRP